MVRPAEYFETKKFRKIHLFPADIQARKSSQKPTIPGHHELRKTNQINFDCNWNWRPDVEAVDII